MKGRSITTKLRIIITGACMAAILLTTCAILSYQLYRYKEDVSSALILRARIFAMNTSAAVAFQNSADAAEVLNAFRLDSAVTSAAIFDDKGELFAEYRAPGRSGKSITPTTDRNAHFMFTDDRIVVWSPIQQQDKWLGTLAFSRTLDELNTRIREFTAIALLVAAITVGCAYWASHFLQGLVSTPLLRLTAVARRVTEERDFKVSVDLNADGEVAILSQAFGEMLRALHDRDKQIRSHAQDLEMKVAERTAQLERSNRDLQMFGSTVSHDLRTPLRGIMGFSEMLAENSHGHLDAGETECLGRIQKNVHKMENLIEGLLRFSRLGKDSLVKSDVDMAGLVKEVVDELTVHQKGRTINFSILQAMPTAHAEPSLVRQVWANLIGNALKFSSGRNPALISIGVFQVDGGPPAYFVRDNGVGFDPQHATKMFGMFERFHSDREFEGSGIGLASVHRIVERHGGRIWAESKPGEGATFYFTLLSA